MTIIFAETVDIERLQAENVALRKACAAARIDLQAIIPVVESALPGIPASSLRNTLGLIHKALGIGR